MGVSSKPDNVKQTEDLLAGFDRTGRTPKTPATRDFVDYHREPQARFASARRMPSPTYVIGRDRKALPGWLPWVGVVFAMLGGGALVAHFVTGSSSPPPSMHFTPLPPSAVATAPATNTRVEEPPPPPEPEPAVEPAPPGSAAAPAPTPSARPKAPPPRSDFARSL